MSEWKEIFEQTFKLYNRANELINDTAQLRHDIYKLMQKLKKMDEQREAAQILEEPGLR